MTYFLDFTNKAKKDLAELKRSEIKAFIKAVKLIDELQKHPTTGTGHPEKLKGNRSGQWSRRITSRHRLVYIIDDNTIKILVVFAAKHYDDK